MRICGFRVLMLGLGPMALTACAEPGPSAANVPSLPSVVAIDLGNSARVRHVPGLAGEGEGYGRTEPGATVAAQGSIPVMSKGQGSIAGMSHGSMAEMQMAHSGHAHAQGTGTVNSVDADAHKLNVSHSAIPTIGWPAMTMDFAVAPSVDLRVVKPGTLIKFTIEQGEGGMYVIQSITPSGGQ